MTRGKMLAALVVCGGMLVSCERGRQAGPAAGLPAGGGAREDSTVNDPKYVLKYTMNRIDGRPEDLGTYRGKVLLIVNTASACGLTPQYAGLESLYERKKDDGLVVLGFPANEFKGQEPGTNEQIERFCTSEYGVSFPMFEKIVVKGEGTHPLYAQLAALPDGLGGEPEWNFQKFLVDRSGRVVGRFSPRTAPDDPELVAAIDRALSASAGG